MGTKTVGVETGSERELGSRGRLYRLAKFATVGLAGYTANLLVFAAAVQVVWYVLAGTVSWFVAIFLSYDLNRRYTFESIEYGYVRGLARHLSVYTVGFVVYTLVLWRLGLWIDTYLALAMAVGVSGVFNFLGSEFWVFDAGP